jgi:hypothetical protein
MNRPLPTSAGAGLAAFGPKILGALLLRRPFYAAVAAEREAWRPAAAMVALAAVARDALQFSDLGLFLTLALANWVFVAIIVIGLLRWLFVAAVAWLPLQVLAPRIDRRALLACLGMAHAPSLLFAVPALLYAFAADQAVTADVFLATAVLLSLWMVAAFTVAVRAATEVSVARALPVALAAHFALLFFNVALDALLYTFYSEAIPATPPF